MRKEAHFTMATPAPGFSARVMQRIAEYEHRRAQWRALIGSALLVAFAGFVLVLIGLWLSAWAAVLVTNPQLIVGLIEGLTALFFWMGTLSDALGAVVAVVEDHLDPLQFILFAAGVFALTLLWTRAFAGSFQLALTNTNHVGGSRK
jgi:hypothetical protein